LTVINGIAEYNIHVTSIFHGRWDSADLKMPIPVHFFRRGILTDLVLGMQSGFIGRSARARLQVSVCSGYDLFQMVVAWRESARCAISLQMMNRG